MPGGVPLHSGRIDVLRDLVRDLSREADPDGLIERFREAMQTAYGPQAVIFVAVRDAEAGTYVVTQLVDEHGERIVESQDVWQGDADRPVRAGGFLGTLMAGGEPRRIAPIEIPEDEVFGRHLAPYRSLLLLPVYEAGEIRFWVVLLHPDPDHYDERDLEAMLLRVNVFSALVANKRLNHELTKASRWIQDEIDQIALVQRSLLPREAPSIPGLEIAARFETFDRAGGDYFDFLPWGDDDGPGRRWTWVVADASGHGPAATVIVAMLHMLLRTLPAPPGGPPEMLAEMNRRLFDCPTCTHFMTAFVGCYDPATRELAYAVAGHHPPLLRAPDGTVGSLPVDPAVPLGILDRLEAPAGRSTLEPGSVLLLYTDGLVEAQNQGLETFGEGRLRQALAEARGDADDILDHLFARVAAHEGSARPNDDQTAVVVRVLP